MINKQSYKGFIVGETVILNDTYKPYDNETTLNKGAEFEILSFPPCVTSGKYQYFVYGKTDSGISVRVSIDLINKMPKYKVMKVMRDSARKILLEKNLTREQAKRIVNSYPDSSRSMVVFYQQ